MNGEVDSDGLRARIAELELELQSTKLLLSQNDTRASIAYEVNGTGHEGDTERTIGHLASPNSSLHHLILLGDSALPVGSFAYSNGLESFLAHHTPIPAGTTKIALFHRFLRLSIQSVAFTNVPYVLTGFRNPRSLINLDNDLDASTPCKVARAASTNQGDALLRVWEKSLSTIAREQFPDMDHVSTELAAFSRELSAAKTSKALYGVNGHLAPLWGVVSLALGQKIDEMAYLFLFNHARAIVSAAVRASVFGPYEAQKVLAGQELQHLIQKSLDKVWDVQTEDAGQVVPTMDLWMGRHELLYSRIFNS